MISKYSTFLILLLVVGCSDSSTAKSTNNSKTTSDVNVDQRVKKDVGGDAAVDRDQHWEKDLQIEKDTGSNKDSGSDTTRPDFGDKPFGGDRPARVILPDDYDVNKSYPLLTLLHGYGVGAQTQNTYLQIGSHATQLQFIMILPDGLVDGSGKKYWNATSGCCDFNGANPDDSGYLIGLVDEAILRYNIDESRVYFMGHSNGGFMSYTMACEYGDRIAAIAALSGTTHLDPTQCADTGDVSVLHIHGNLDGTININGRTRNGTLDGYPGALETVNRWVTRNGCQAVAIDGTNINILTSAPGRETRVKTKSKTEVQRLRNPIRNPAISSRKCKSF